MQLNKGEKIDIILILMIICLIAVIGYAISILKQDALICLSNPVQYYESLQNLTCMCSKDIPDFIFINP